MPTIPVLWISAEDLITVDTVVADPIQRPPRKVARIEEGYSPIKGAFVRVWYAGSAMPVEYAPTDRLSIIDHEAQEPSPLLDEALDGPRHPGFFFDGSVGVRILSSSVRLNGSRPAEAAPQRVTSAQLCEATAALFDAAPLSFDQATAVVDGAVLLLASTFGESRAVDLLGAVTTPETAAAIVAMLAAS